MPEKLFAPSQKPECFLFGVGVVGSFCLCVFLTSVGWRYLTALLPEGSYLQHIQPSTASISKKRLQKQFSHDIVDPRWRKGHQLHQNTRLCGSLGMSIISKA